MAGPFDLTGQNIEDTYQRILQTDGTNIYNGTGSLFSIPSAFPYTGSAQITGSLGVTGSISISGSGLVTIGMSGSAYGPTGTNNGKLTINNTSGNNAIAIRAGETGYQLAIKTTVSDSIGAEFVWFDGATITFLQYGGGIGARLGASGFAQFRANNYTPDGNATIHTGNSNAERLRVTNAGLIGIGTTLPSASLHIKGATSSSLSSSLLIQNANNSSSFTVLDNGFVGVGTANPTYKFYASDTGTSGVTHFLAFRNDNNDYGGITIGSGVGGNLTIQQNSGYGYLSTTGFRIGSANGIIWTNNGSIFRIVDAATELINYLRIASNTGNVLINTSTDSGYKFDVSGSIRSTNGINITGSFSSYTTSSAGFVAVVSGSQPAQDIAFNFRKIGESSDGARHTMIVEGSGAQDNNIYFGVGQAGGAKGSILCVKGNSSVNINMPLPTINYGGLAVGGWLAGYPSLLVRGFGATSATTAMRVENSNTSASLVILDNGNVGINITTPAYNLDVNGSSAFRGRVNILGEAELRQDGITQTFSSAYGIFQFRGWSANNLTAYLNAWNYEGYLNFALNIGSGSIATPSAVLEVTSTTRGFRPPRTATTASISSPAQGLMTYLTGSTNEGLYYYNSGSQTGWHKMLTNTGSQGITGSLNITNGLIVSGSTTINDALAINIPETGGPIDNTTPAGFYKATVNGAVVFLPYYL